MLDVQRYRESSLYVEFRLTRAILLVHLGLGMLAVILLLLHEIYPWAFAALGWYCATLVTLVVMTKRGGFRILMGLLFLLFSAAGIYFLTQVAPRLQPQAPPLVPHGILSVWLGLVNFAYAIAGVILLFNTRVRRVTANGFCLR